MLHGVILPSFFFFPFIPFVVLALLSRSIPVVAQIRGHTTGILHHFCVFHRGWNYSR